MARAFLGSATALLGVLVFATAALAGSTTTENVSGTGAAANFLTVNGCIQDNIVIATGSQVTKTPGGSTVSTTVDLTIAAFDLCNNADLGTSSGGANSTSFSGDLNSASLNAAIPVIDPLNNVTVVPVSLSWSRSGSVTRTHNTTRIVTGNVTTTITTRDAAANASVSGSVNGVAVGSVASAMLFNNSTITTTH
jgi:hypothetical protein